MEVERSVSAASRGASSSTTSTAATRTPGVLEKDGEALLIVDGISGSRRSLSVVDRPRRRTRGRKAKCQSSHSSLRAHRDVSRDLGRDRPNAGQRYYFAMQLIITTAVF